MAASGLDCEVDGHDAVAADEGWRNSADQSEEGRLFRRDDTYDAGRLGDGEVCSTDRRPGFTLPKT